MKTAFLLMASMCSFLIAFAAGNLLVDKGTVKMKNGVADYSEISYAFAKGDKIVIHARASKRLDQMNITLYPDTRIGKIRAAKKMDYTFTMPEDGFILIRFISDRGGTNHVDYTITRTPASDAVANYKTKVIWEKPENTVGPLMPKQAE